jgi:hypothetical protein
MMVLRKGIAMILLWRVDTLAPINSRLQDAAVAVAGIPAQDSPARTSYILR